MSDLPPPQWGGPGATIGGQGAAFDRRASAWRHRREKGFRNEWGRIQPTVAGLAALAKASGARLGTFPSGGADDHAGRREDSLNNRATNRSNLR
jgi:hypothetical protein